MQGRNRFSRDPWHVSSYPPDENFWIVKAITERKLGNQKEALNIINEQLDINPLNHAARFEKYLNTKDPAGMAT